MITNFQGSGMIRLHYMYGHLSPLGGVINGDRRNLLGDYENDISKGINSM